MILASVVTDLITPASPTFGNAYGVFHCTHMQKENQAYTENATDINCCKMIGEVNV